MKAMKRLFALLLALTMVFGLAVTGFAAGETSGVSPETKGTIVIENPNKGTLYEAYRLLDLESWSVPDKINPDNPDPNANGNYSYKLNDTWAPFFGFEKDSNGVWKAVVVDEGETAAPGTGYLTLDPAGQGYVTFVEAKKGEIAQLAKDALAWAKSQTPAIDSNASGTGPASGTLTLTTDGEAVSNNNDQLPLGWYLVSTELGSLCSLGTTDNTAEIREKNEQVTEKKEVKEKGTKEVWYNGEEANAEDGRNFNNVDIGSTVEFRATIDAKEGAEKYIFHDKMDAALDFDATSVKVYKLTTTKPDPDDDATTGNKLTAYTDTEWDAETEKNADYWLNKTPAPHEVDKEPWNKAEACTFEVEFSKTFLDGLKDDDKILITYEAVLNSGATMDTDIKNHSKIQFGQDNYSEDSTTNTKTYELNIWKYWNDSNNTQKPETSLGGAEFVLYKKGGTDTVPTYEYLKITPSGSIYLPLSTKTGEKEDPDSHWYSNTNKTKLADTDFGTGEGKVDNCIMTSDATTGYIMIHGLDAGTYYLHETKAPAGFNKLQGDIKIVIEDTKVGEETEFTYKVTYQQLDKDGKPVGTTAEDAKDGTDGVKEIVKVENNYGREMPATGGIGTTLFYVIGGIMVIGAAVILITKKRVNM